MLWLSRSNQRRFPLGTARRCCSLLTVLALFGGSGCSSASESNAASTTDGGAPAPTQGQAQAIPFEEAHPAAADSEAAIDAAIPESGEEETPLRVPDRLREPPLADAKPLKPAQNFRARAKLGNNGRLTVQLGGKTEVLTLDAALEEKLAAIMKNYQTPYAAVAVIEPSSGRVLALVEHSERNPKLNGLTTRPLFPAASIFKMVTASALLERGVKNGTEVCTHGAKRSVSLANLKDSIRDRKCMTLEDAFGKSANGVFAKLTHRYLKADQLLERAEKAFAFNRTIPFALPLEASPAAVPKETLALAETGAGFGDVFMSPLHGALMASVVANGGVWKDPLVLESEFAAPPKPARVMSTTHARALADMMQASVVSGTARRTFRERGYQVPGAVGKTGSLADKRPVFRDYSWFVGYAPKSAPKVAVAAVIVNEMQWRIRATYLGREALRLGMTAAHDPTPVIESRESPGHAAGTRGRAP